VMGLMIIMGTVKWIGGTLHPDPNNTLFLHHGYLSTLPARFKDAIGPGKKGLETAFLYGAGLFVVLKAFASGGTAVTGVEAISNGVTAFRRPEWLNARKTLVIMGGVLAVLFLGLSSLSTKTHPVVYRSGSPTVISQVGKGVFGAGLGGHGLFYLLQAGTMLILVLAANTSFADFPRLSSILARDRFLPHQFAFRGDRLAFNTGILVLAALAAVLEVGFQGSVNNLIPLYAVGVFTAFTLSQSGMVIHWRRLRDRGWRHRATINGAGAVMTGVATVIIAASKFLEGAWIVLLVIPLIIWQLRKIHRHYEQVADQLRLPAETLPRRTGVAPHQTIVVVPIASLNRASLNAIEYAEGISANVIVVHVVGSESEGEDLRREWNEAGFQLPLVLIESPYRQLVRPVVDFVEQQHEETGQIVTVVLPEFVPAHLYEVPLHNQTAWRLRTALWTHPGVVTVSVPHHLTV
ncbi:MAG TPA: amino acid permease, partial [Thermomicrobiaceae bacterium]|nr:amino acid permease [Thermomicrobiaceae bacterium]